VESLRKGLSGMDAARAAMGQGWPFAACPWSKDGTKGVSRSETPDVGCAFSLVTFSLHKQRESNSPGRRKA